MNKLKISTRLVLLVGTLSALLVALGAIGLFGLSRTSDSVWHVYEGNTVPMGQVAEIQERLLSNRLAIAVALVTPDAQTIADKTAEVERNIVAVNRVWASFQAGALTDQDQALARTFTQHRAQFVRLGLEPAVAALKAGDIAQAKRVVAEVVRPLYVPSTPA